jgi:probable HAF family extracellular repeat protein
MDTLKVRAYLRKYGHAGYLLVGIYLIVHTLFSRRPRRILGILAVALLVLWSWRAFHSHAQVRHSPIADISLPETISSDQAPYTITDLGILPGYDSAVAVRINNNSQMSVVLYTSTRTKLHSFLWQEGKWTDVGTLGGNYTLAFGLNDNGQVVGRSHTGRSEERPFLWRNGKIENLGTFGGDEPEDRDLSNVATGINNRGQVVGAAETKKDGTHAFLWQDGNLQDIGKSIRSKDNYAYGINNSGQVAGVYITNLYTPHAFVYTTGKITTLPMPKGGDGTAYAINDQGQVVGSTSVRSGDTHPFLYSQGKTIDLGTLGGKYGYALAINDKTQVVGGSDIGKDEEEHAFLWQKGKMTDLNTLIPAHSGWELYRAYSINNQGQIVGGGILNGKKRAFLLTPKG